MDRWVLHELGALTPRRHGGVRGVRLSCRDAAASNVLRRHHERDVFRHREGSALHTCGVEPRAAIRANDAACRARHARQALRARPRPLLRGSLGPHAGCPISRRACTWRRGPILRSNGTMRCWRRSTSVCWRSATPSTGRWSGCAHPGAIGRSLDARVTVHAADPGLRDWLARTRIESRCSSSLKRHWRRVRSATRMPSCQASG